MIRDFNFYMGKQAGMSHQDILDTLPWHELTMKELFQRVRQRFRPFAELIR
jgi:hypothetical protein